MVGYLFRLLWATMRERREHLPGCYPFLSGSVPSVFVIYFVTFIHSSRFQSNGCAGQTSNRSLRPDGLAQACAPPDWLHERVSLSAHIISGHSMYKSEREWSTPPAGLLLD